MENTSIKKSLVDELIEDKDFDHKIIKTFYSKNELCPDIFEKLGKSYIMIKDVREKLLNIANAFIEFMGVDFFIYDVILAGSLSNYNWSEYSDVDLHIICDITDISNSPALQKMIKEFFDSKKNNWNSQHHVKIKNYDVELYVQDAGENLFSSGIYSILNNKWNSNPQKGKEGIDEDQILSKGEEYVNLIDDLNTKFESGIDITKEIDDVKSKLKKFRQSGLERGGEFSYENLTFKLLRRNGYIEKLLKLKKDVMDKKLSVTQ